MARGVRVCEWRRVTEPVRGYEGRAERWQYEEIAARGWEAQEQAEQGPDGARKEEEEEGESGRIRMILPTG